MKNFLQKHLAVLFLTSLVVLATILSRWIIGYLPFSGLISKVCTVLNYLPFALLILWKLICDIRKPQKDLFFWCYYVFALYYAAISIYRFCTGGEVKENLYYTLIFFGSVALFDLQQRKLFPFTGSELSKDMYIFSAILVGYRIVYLLFFERILWHSPVNEIALGACILLLLPVAFHGLRNSGTTRAGLTFGLLIGGICFVYLTLGSRAVFAICSVGLIPLTLSCIKNKRALLISVGSIACAIAVVIGLFALNTGTIRYSVFRETQLAFIGDMIESSSSAGTEGGSEMADIAEGQISRSDSMRENLSQYSLEQVRKNPWIGTGDVMFEHTYNQQTQTINAPPHNIFLQTLNCYGIFGLLQIALILICMLIKAGLFQFRDKKWADRIGLTILLAGFFSISMIQATAYDILVLPTMVLSLLVFSTSLSKHNTEA